jgi:hypothetical protein
MLQNAGFAISAERLWAFRFRFSNGQSIAAARHRNLFDQP